MKKIFFFTMMLLTTSQLMAAGALQGKFSVSATKQVRFSKGNLQHQASTSTWRFAEQQWNVVGSSNENISPTYDGWIDLYGWGTGDNPTLSSSNTEDYPTTFVEWGNNTISNGSGNPWRTLKGAEWRYILNERTNAENLRSQATVNGVAGYVLLPDNWTLPSGLSFTANAGDYTTNQYGADEWSAMETAGALFLPAAGYRQRFSESSIGIMSINTSGRYWTSTEADEGSTSALIFGATTYNVYPYAVFWGFSVRLATENLADVGHTVTFQDYDGTQLKQETVSDGDPAHAPDTEPTREGYNFTGWDKDFTSVTEDMTITAQYEIKKYTVTFCGVNASTVVKTYTNVEHGSPVTPPEPKDDYESLDFVEWESDAYMNVTSDLTILGVYKLKTYSVTFEDQWGNLLGVVETEYGKDADPAGLDISDKECWTQNGFSESWQGIHSNKTIVVYYLQKEYTVTFKGWKDGDAEAVLWTGKVGCGDAATPPAVPEREDYGFTGWDTDFSEVKGDLTVTAQYELSQYTVSVVADHGSVSAADADGNAVDLSERVAHGTVLRLTAVADEGYEFVAWTNYDPATGLTVKSDVTVTATFKETKATGIESVVGAEKAQKVVRGGQLLILHDGKTYNVLGGEMK